MAKHNRNRNSKNRESFSDTSSTSSGNTSTEAAAVFRKDPDGKVFFTANSLQQKEQQLKKAFSVVEQLEEESVACSSDSEYSNWHLPPPKQDDTSDVRHYTRAIRTGQPPDVTSPYDRHRKARHHTSSAASTASNGSQKRSSQSHSGHSSSLVIAIKIDFAEVKLDSEDPKQYNIVASVNGDVVHQTRNTQALAGRNPKLGTAYWNDFFLLKKCRVDSSNKITNPQTVAFFLQEHTGSRAPVDIGCNLKALTLNHFDNRTKEINVPMGDHKLTIAVTMSKSTRPDISLNSSSDLTNKKGSHQQPDQQTASVQVIGVQSRGGLVNDIDHVHIRHDGQSYEIKGDELTGEEGRAGKPVLLNIQDMHTTITYSVYTTTAFLGNCEVNLSTFQLGENVRWLPLINCDTPALVGIRVATSGVGWPAKSKPKERLTIRESRSPTTSPLPMSPLAAFSDTSESSSSDWDTDVFIPSVQMLIITVVKAKLEYCDSMDDRTSHFVHLQLWGKEATTSPETSNENPLHWNESFRFEPSGNIHDGNDDELLITVTSQDQNTSGPRIAAAIFKIDDTVMAERGEVSKWITLRDREVKVGKLMLHFDPRIVSKKKSRRDNKRSNLTETDWALSMQTYPPAGGLSSAALKRNSFTSNSHHHQTQRLSTTNINTSTNTPLMNDNGDDAPLAVIGHHFNETGNTPTATSGSGVPKKRTSSSFASSHAGFSPTTNVATRRHSSNPQQQQHHTSTPLVPSASVPTLPSHRAPPTLATIQQQEEEIGALRRELNHKNKEIQEFKAKQHVPSKYQPRDPVEANAKACDVECVIL